MAKEKLCLHSNRQDSVAETLHGHSIKTRLDTIQWTRAMMGDESALKYVLDHCKKDVRELERNYNSLIPYVKKANRSI